MNLRQKLINIEETNYTSKLSEAELKLQLEHLFNNNTLGLVGRFNSNTEFTVHNKMNIIGWSMPHLKRKSAYGYGTFANTQKGTLLNLLIKPNSILPIFAIAAAITGFILLLVVLLMSEYDGFYLFFGLLLIVLSLVYYPLSIYFRNQLRNKIVNFLELNSVQS